MSSCRRPYFLRVFTLHRKPKEPHEYIHGSVEFFKRTPPQVNETLSLPSNLFIWNHYFLPLQLFATLSHFSSYRSSLVFRLLHHVSPSLFLCWFTCVRSETLPSSVLNISTISLPCQMGPGSAGPRNWSPSRVTPPYYIINQWIRCVHAHYIFSYNSLQLAAFRTNCWALADWAVGGTGMRSPCSSRWLHSLVLPWWDSILR